MFAQHAASGGIYVEAPGREEADMTPASDVRRNAFTGFIKPDRHATVMRWAAAARPTGPLPMTATGRSFVLMLTPLNVCWLAFSCTSHPRLCTILGEVSEQSLHLLVARRVDHRSTIASDRH